MVLVAVHTNKFENFIITIIGRIKAISTSKIKKIIAIRKNCKEKGSREEDLGSNPHSKGEFFSRSMTDFFESSEANNMTTIEMMIRIIAVQNIINIIFTINK